MIRLLDVADNTVGNTFLTDDRFRFHKRVVQVEITGTATVKVQGRCSNDFSWTDLGTYTANTGEAVQVFHQMRAVSSGMAGATVKVQLDVSAQR